MKWILDAFFPTHCLHCKQEIEGDLSICPPCLELFNSPIDPATRCRFCFSEGHFETKKQCPFCREHTLPFAQMGAVFDYVGPAKTLVEAFKREGRGEWAKTFAAYMVVQHERLGWPKPDVITSIPLSFNRTLLRGFNQSERMALEFSQFLGVPYLRTLKRINGEFPQSSFPLKSRNTPLKSSFFPKKGVDLSNQTVLLVDDVMVTGSTLIGAGEALLRLYPSRVYSFCLCKF